jgi:hypothetical protein
VDLDTFDLQTLIELLGQPYAGEVDGTRIGSQPAPDIRVAIHMTTESGRRAERADYCRWDCFGVLHTLEMESIVLLSGSRTARNAEYNRAVQELAPLVSCAVTREREGRWTFSYICCKHESTFRAPP